MNRKALTTMVTFPLEDLGIIAKDMWPSGSKTKRSKAVHFRKQKKMLVLFSIVAATDDIQCIGVGTAPDGTIVGHVSFIPRGDK